MSNTLFSHELTPAFNSAEFREIGRAAYERGYADAMQFAKAAVLAAAAKDLPRLLPPPAVPTSPEPPKAPAKSPAA